MSAAALAVLAALAWSSSTSPARVYIAAGALEAPITDALTAELPGSVASSTSAADLLLRVERRSSDLALTIRDPLGRPVLTRTVSLADGLTPALRRVVLVVTQAAENVAGAPPEPPAPPPPPPPRAPATPILTPIIQPQRSLLSISAGATFALWPDAPQLGATAAASTNIGRWDLGGRVTFVGAACCRQTERGISADARELAISAELGYRLVDLDWGKLRFHAGAGVGWMRADVRPDAFAGPGPSQRFSRLSPVAETGATAELFLARPWLSIELSTGLSVRFIRETLALPPDYGAADLDPGLANPWIRAAAATHVDFL